MASPYAARTTVPVDRSRAEIERTLERYGADAFSFTKTPEGASIGFRMRGRLLKIRIPMPPPERTATAQRVRDQEIRRRYRVLLLQLKATLESVDAGVVDFDQAFLGFLILPDGRSYSEFAQPEIEQAYSTGRMPLALPGA
jgi:hypothetical protein